VSYDAAGIGTLTIEGTFQRTTTTGARAGATALAAARASAVLAVLGGTWELVGGVDLRVASDDSTATFRSIYRQRVYGQVASGTLDHPDLADSVLEVTRSAAPGPDGGLKVQRVEARWTGSVRQGGSTTPEQACALAQDWCVAEASRIAGGLALTEAVWSISPDRRTVEVRIVGTAAGSDGPGTVLRRVTRVRDDLDDRVSILDVWGELGDARAYEPGRAHVFRAPAAIRRTLEVVEARVGRIADQAPIDQTSPLTQGWTHLRSSPTQEEESTGTNELGERVWLSTLSVVSQWALVQVQRTGSTGASGGGLLADGAWPSGPQNGG
jgi:hypothetical protein